MGDGHKRRARPFSLLRLQAVAAGRAQHHKAPQAPAPAFGSSGGTMARRLRLTLAAALLLLAAPALAEPHYIVCTSDFPPM